jgi:hypothetical protein
MFTPPFVTVFDPMTTSAGTMAGKKKPKKGPIAVGF